MRRRKGEEETGESLTPTFIGRHLPWSILALLYYLAVDSETNAGWPKPKKLKLGLRCSLTTSVKTQRSSMFFDSDRQIDK